MVTVNQAVWCRGYLERNKIVVWGEIRLPKGRLNDGTEETLTGASWRMGRGAGELVSGSGNVGEQKTQKRMLGDKFDK
ncbi:hypothetical protein CRYUN_Cryun17cG0091300 [Craigia yunnanensis]